jgi:hypothetical protein
MNQEKEGPSDNAAVVGWADASRACTGTVGNVQSSGAQTCAKCSLSFQIFLPSTLDFTDLSGL